MVNRWNLVKKDPDAPLSEPVEPITWWIENTTPVEFRPAIREGVLRWNEAFETAGFKNAVVVKDQPDTATWDAGDLRYNVLRWTASPNPPFGGYGPSFVNPRTGQILGADIMLEFIFVTNRVLQSEVFDVAGQSDGAVLGRSRTHGRLRRPVPDAAADAPRGGGAAAGRAPRTRRSTRSSSRPSSAWSCTRWGTRSGSTTT